MNNEKYLMPVHPGEVLWEDFMKPAGLTQNALAREIGVPPRRINEIIHGNRAITADTALRLSKFFGTSAQVWMNLQSDYELDCIMYAERTGKRESLDFIKQFVCDPAMA